MATIHGYNFGAFVVEATFLGDKTAFVLGDGSIRLADGSDAATVGVHAGAILSAAGTRDGALVSGGDDGVLALTKADGTVTRLADRPRKWIEMVAAGPAGVTAFAVGKQAVV